MLPENTSILDILPISLQDIFPYDFKTCGLRQVRRDYSKPNRKVLMNKFIIIIAAVLLPPLAVFLKKGIGKHFFINLVLTLFFFVPGIIHGVWLVTK
jgi:uncharacterized membrane protein YqaE (UPF0057 family)